MIKLIANLFAVFFSLLGNWLEFFVEDGLCNCMYSCLCNVRMVFFFLCGFVREELLL